MNDMFYKNSEKYPTVSDNVDVFDAKTIKVLSIENAEKVVNEVIAPIIKKTAKEGGFGCMIFLDQLPMSCRDSSFKTYLFRVFKEKGFEISVKFEEDAFGKQRNGYYIYWI